jgi:hypothetical protein
MLLYKLPHRRRCAGKIARAPRIVGRNGATQLVLYRKDRIHFTKGTALLKEYRLTPESPTRRIVANCCNTSICLDFTKGHWLSLYSCLWPAHTLPPIQMRTMTSDALEGTILSDDVANHKRYALSSRPANHNSCTNRNVVCDRPKTLSMSAFCDGRVLSSGLLENATHEL